MGSNIVKFLALAVYAMIRCVTKCCSGGWLWLPVLLSDLPKEINHTEQQNIQTHHRFPVCLIGRAEKVVSRRSLFHTQMSRLCYSDSNLADFLTVFTYHNQRLFPGMRMSNTQSVKRQLQKLKKAHSFVAPLVILPIILTLVTGTIYQAFDLTGNGDSVEWLLSLHKGNFGPLRLEVVYPFLNALGLLFMAITGGTMWLELRRIRQSSRRDA